MADMTDHPCDDAKHLRQWAADIRASSGMSVDADRLDAIASNIDSLTFTIARCADALGNGAGIAPTASIEFMEKLPEEIFAHVSRIREEVRGERWRAEMNAASAATLTELLSIIPLKDVLSPAIIKPRCFSNSARS